MASASEIALLDEENIIEEINPHWSKWWFWWLILVWFIVTLIIPYLWMKNHKYVVTNQRLIEIEGLLGTSTTEYRISDIRSIQTEQSFIGKQFGVGTLKFSTGTVDSIEFDGIKNHQQVANTIRDIQQEME